MRADKIIAAEETVTLAAAIGGDLIAQGAVRGLPNPRKLVGILIFFGGLSWVSSFGSGAARFAAAVGGVVMLANLVLGPGGKAIVGLVNTGAGLAATPAGVKPTTPAGAAPPSSSPGGGGVGGTLKKAASTVTLPGESAAVQALVKALGGLFSKATSGGTGKSDIPAERKNSR